MINDHMRALGKHKPQHRGLYRLLLPIATCMLLCGCMGAIVAGGAAGKVINDSRSINQMNQDLTIDHDARLALARDPKLKASHLVISCYKQMLFLGGQVPEPSLKSYAAQQALSIPGVTRVYNQITVGPNNDSPRGVAKDVWISAKVRAQMLTRRGLKSGTIDVITEAGVVYLMGSVTHDQANLAVDVARRVEGVTRVVKLFKYSD